MENQIETSKFIPEKAKQIALARLDLVHKWLEFRRKSNIKIQADYDFVKLHNTTDSHLRQVLGKVSRGSLHRWNAMLDDFEDYEKLHSAWHDDYIPTIEETIKMIDMWLKFKNSQTCPNAPNKTIAEILKDRKRQNINPDTLDDLMLATEVKTIQRNGVRFLGCDYFDERLYGFKSKVLIKYNLFDLTKIKVFAPKGEYLCTAERVTEIHQMAP